MRLLTTTFLLLGTTAFAAPHLKPASVVRFDASNPEVQEFAKQQGWARPGYQTSLLGGELHYTSNGWKTVHKAPLQFLHDNTRGFTIRDMKPGTKIEYAAHVRAGASYNHFRSYEFQGESWANNGGKNYQAKTAPLPK